MSRTSRLRRVGIGTTPPRIQPIHRRDGFTFGSTIGRVAHSPHRRQLDARAIPCIRRMLPGTARVPAALRMVGSSNPANRYSLPGEDYENQRLCTPESPTHSGVIKVARGEL